MDKIDKITREQIEQYIKEETSRVFAKNLQDEELSEGVTYLHTQDTNLPYDIIVDSGKNYEYYNHALCLYIVYGKNVHPVKITRNLDYVFRTKPVHFVAECRR